MPREFKTPGIYRREIDLSDILIPAGISDGGTVIRAKKGPVNRPVLISNDKEFVETFGEPIYVSGTGLTTEKAKLIPEYGYGAYASLEFLKESSVLYVVRDFSSGDMYANNQTNISNVEQNATNISGTQATTPDKPDTISIVNTAALTSSNLIIAATYPGTDGNSVAVTIETFNTSADWKFSYDEYPLVLSATSAAFSATGGDTGVDTMGPASVYAYYPIASKVFKMNVYSKPTDKSWTDLFTTSADRLNNKLRIEPVETFYGSLEDGLKDINKNNLYVETVVNGNSKYVYIKKGGSMTGSRFPLMTASSQLPVREDTTSEYVDYTLLRELTRGYGVKDNGLDNTTGWSFFDNREDVNVGILIGHSYDQAYKQEVARVAAKRMDCIAVCQTGELDDLTTTDVINSEKYGYQAPSYVALYAGYSKIYDRYNDKEVYIPNSIMGAEIMARTDNIADPWSAPAGIDRATLSVLDQRKVWSFDEIGKLYDKNINTTRFIRGVGHVLWGQKTAQLKKTALDRVNVRRNLLYIENNCEPALLPFVFENNTDKTRLRIWTIIDEFLSGVQAGGGLYAYQVVCDTTNNTSTVIDSNQLNVDIYVQPTKVSEFIQLTTVITRTGISFSEVRLAVA